MQGPGQNFRAVREFFRFGRMISGFWRGGTSSAELSGRLDISRLVAECPGVSQHLLASFDVQQNEIACSLASAAMVFNAARRLGNANPAMCTQTELLELVGCSEWKAAVSPHGNGVVLDHLAQLVGRCLAAGGMRASQMEIVHVDHPATAARDRLRDDLTAAGGSSDRFVIANFLQSALTGNGIDNIGHYAPIAGYDAAGRRVLILDPDRHRPGPCWVAEDLFLAGLATHDVCAGRSRGYLCIQIEVGQPQSGS
jgi:hypothetical protein